MDTQTLLMLKTLDINEIAARQKDGDVLIDVRTPAEHHEGHIANSLHIDIYSPDFQSKIKELDQSKTYYLYCRSGNRSGTAGNFMLQLGFTDVCNLTGGMMSYRGEVERS
jgi:rhodanese-related sulfurtransferase